MTRSVLVTGASTGIGEATARRLDELGVRVFAGVRRDEDAEKLKAGQTARLTPVSLDITDEEQVGSVLGEIADTVGDDGLQGVVNNAGVARGGPLEYLPLDDWRLQLEVNVIGQIAVARAALPLIRTGRGRVVFVGSMSGRVSTMLMGPYGASKFAIEAIGESLRAELHPWKIPVAVIEPGAIRTAIWDKGRDLADELEERMPPEAVERYAQHIAGVRKGIEMQDRSGIPPDRVAEAIEHALFARRPRHRYVVGRDAKAAAIMIRLLPDRAKDAVMRRIAGP